ncbi:hypothetical protein TL16_g12699 [Triparma laevis f. inornata]|uniref:WW domain-containing protein n=1 Tax=Triparma laevis f. inornata TaxID=1714386 RepID=A0A9W7EX92_9STRA|nr:hypothetical protein TL16_g12699 [Triparma laevis f. inornata]
MHALPLTPEISVLLTAPQASDLLTCPEDDSFNQVGNQCKFWKGGAEVNIQETENNPFPECLTFNRCTPNEVIDGGTWKGDSERMRYMCVKCKAAYRPTEIAANTVGGTCPQSNYYMDNCYEPEAQANGWTQEGTFPSNCPASDYRTNTCEYMSQQQWVAASVGQPLGGYTYKVMCNECEDGYYASTFNHAAGSTAGTCPKNDMPTVCTKGSAPDNPTPVPPPQDNPTPAPTPSQSFFERNMKYIAEAAVALAFILLVLYIFYSKRKRAKKKMRKMQQDAKVKRQSAVDKQKLIELQRRSKEKKSIVKKGGLTEEEKKARRAAKKEKNERIAAALDEGLPPGWRSFTDKASGGVYYVHLDSGETTWTRPVATKIITQEIIEMVDNPMTEENEALKEQMKKLVDANRNLKKDMMNSSKTSLNSTHPIDQAKKKKAAGMWKAAGAKAKLQARGSAPSDKLRAAVKLVGANKEIEEAQAQLPKPPSVQNLGIGTPPAGPKPDSTE